MLKRGRAQARQGEKEGEGAGKGWKYRPLKAEGRSQTFCPKMVKEQYVALWTARMKVLSAPQI